MAIKESLPEYYPMSGGDGPNSYSQNSTAQTAKEEREELGEMANEDTKTLPKSWAMIGGDGPTSYAHNSWYQKLSMDVAKEMMTEGIANNLDFNNPCFGTSKTFKIADFGCSVGPNTFFAIEKIIGAVDQKYHAQFQNPPPLELQVFFNDVIGNDFNTLFKALPSYQKYFAAGVPGTFYGRLFPKSSLHLGCASYALNWLSKIPQEIVDVNSPAWNKGSIHFGGSVEVFKAYRTQYKDDMGTFLNSRAQEIVGGGLVIILMFCRPDGVPTSETEIAKSFDLLGSTVTDMVKMGLISEQKAVSFNVPVHCPSPKELEEIIKDNGNFSIEKMDRVNNLTWQTMNTSVEAAVLGYRATLGGVLKEHFGSEKIVDKIFQHFTKKLAENPSLFHEITHNQNDQFILLKRNFD